MLGGAGLVNQVEDVVQDAILALWKRFQDTGKAPSSWVAVMMNRAKFCALDLIVRRRSVEPSSRVQAASQTM